MPEDPIVEEVRKVRREIEAECGGDAKIYYEHLMVLQEQWRGRLVRRQPQPVFGVKAPPGDS